MPDQLDRDIAVIKEKLVTVANGMQEFKAVVTQQYEKMEEKVDVIAVGEANHQRRISILEADESRDMLIEQMKELKEVWTKNQEHMWRVIIILILILAAIVGVNKLPALAF